MIVLITSQKLLGMHADEWEGKHCSLERADLNFCFPITQQYKLQVNNGFVLQFLVALDPGRSSLAIL